MIDVKTAVSKAFEYIRELMPEAELKDLRLEEVEFDEEKEHWCVTLGFDTGKVVKRNSSPGGLFAETIQEPQRSYKELRIDQESGKFISMKMM